jgi:PAS domain S-box-containing protein
VVGLLGLANKPGGFTEYDISMASAFGELASIALLNSRSLETLRSSEERFRSVAQTANDAIITIDSGGNVAFWNETAADIFGYKFADAFGKPLNFIIPERFRARHKSGIERVVSSGKSDLAGKTVEMIGLKKDGQEFPVELSLSSWTFKEEIFFTGIIRDITERKQAEDEIKGLARFTGENRNPVLRVSQDGTVLYANDASEPLLAQWNSPVNEKIPDRWRRLVEPVIGSGESYRTEVNCDERIFSLDIVPILEAGYFNIYGRDITERKRTETLLVEQNKFITTVFESLSHPFYVIDASDYTVKMANSAAHSGQLPETISCYSLIHGQDSPCKGPGFLCPLEEIKKTRLPVVTEHLHRDTKGDNCVFEVHAHPIFDIQGEVTQIIEYTLDITERKRMEDELRERTHQLGERVKELNCLYGITALVEKPDTSLEEILQGTAELIPPSWQYPDITGARVILEGQEFRTPRFKETAPGQQTTGITVYGQRIGTVEICYLEQRSESDEGPFLKEERSLINAIAEELGRVVERERAEEALRKSEKKYRQLVELAQEGVWVIDAENKTTFANPRMAEMLSYSEAEMLGKHLFSFMDERGMEIAKWNLERRRQGIKEQHDFEFLRQDGTRVYTSMETSPINDEEGNYVGALALVADITERRRAEEALRQAHDELDRRVQERTAQLVRANEKLQDEITRRRQAHEAEQKARQIAETLSAASQALTMTLDLDKVLETLLEFLGRLVPYDSALVFLAEDESNLKVRSVRGQNSWTETQQLLGSTIGIADNRHIHSLLGTQRSIMIADTRQHSNWKAYLGREHVVSWLGVPLIADDKVIGFCGLEKNEPGFFNREHLQLSEAFVAQAAVALQNAWLFEQVRAGRERLQSLSRRLVEVQETERRYIARELHDEAGQVLASLMVGLRLLERDANKPEAILTGVAELRIMVDDVLDNLHRLAVDLRPASLDHLGLVGALRQYVHDVSNKQDLVAQFEVVGVDTRLPIDVETALYRIVQEAMTNVIRHAQATRVDVLLEQRGDKLVVIVEDNGVGFDPAAARHGDRLGLFGMRERAEMLGGELLIECTAEVGTTVFVEVPYVHSHSHSG